MLATCANGIGRRCATWHEWIQRHVFRTRLALSIIDAIGAGDDLEVHRISGDLITQSTTGNDGYAARDVLTHRGCGRFLTHAT